MTGPRRRPATQRPEGLHTVLLDLLAGVFAAAAVWAAVSTLATLLGIGGAQ
jgi:hypothetical protein